MNVNEIPLGAKLQLEDGSTVEVIRASTDGDSLAIRYLESPFDPDLVGVEGLCTDYEITGFAADWTHTDTRDVLDGSEKQTVPTPGMSN
ncbi:MAG: hypothetical protein HW416_2233 [Chloroflexi bacterium]|nr:hypothetical protein [Chloroflexota bacterium]